MSYDQPDPAAASSFTAVIGDDRPVFRVGLVTLLSNLEVVAELPIDRVAETAKRTSPDVVVLGLRNDDPATFHAAARVKALTPRTGILVVADSTTVIEMREAVIAGVDSFLLSSADPDELVDAALRTAAGERVIAGSIDRQLADNDGDPTPRRRTTPPSPRELQVLQLLAEGMTNQQIAAQLSLSPRTVKTHVQNLLVKLGTPDRTGAVARGFRLGLIR